MLDTLFDIRYTVPRDEARSTRNAKKLLARYGDVHVKKAKIIYSLTQGENTMADANDKVGSNVEGSWFVDSQCIDCDLCRTTAPNNFQQNADDGYSYVFKQPENDEETKLCQEALDE